jgi:hypothetical protein
MLILELCSDSIPSLGQEPIELWPKTPAIFGVMGFMELAPRAVSRGDDKEIPQLAMY